MALHGDAVATTWLPSASMPCLSLPIIANTEAIGPLIFSQRELQTHRRHGRSAHLRLCTWSPDRCCTRCFGTCKAGTGKWDSADVRPSMHAATVVCPWDFVGDLHGDLAQTRSALQLAGVLSSDGQNSWIGGETVLVQLGDILDRGEDEIAILSLLRSLDIEAKLNGGAVFQVNGNHETMNVEGDFRYVDPGAFDECMDFLEYLDEFGDNWEEAFLQWISVSGRRKEDHRMLQSHWGSWNIVKRRKGIVARSSLLSPGGPLAYELARHAVVLKIDDWLFCHGGLLPHHAAYGIEKMNKEVSCWMQGFTKSDSPEIPFIATRGYDSVVWNRLYSRDSADMKYQTWQISSIVEDTLQATGAKAMVVGHTPQSNGVNCKYNHRIWCIDVGMSSGVLNSRPEVLEIVDDKATVLRGQTKFFDGLEVSDYI